MMRKLILRISVSIYGFAESSDGKIDFAKSRSHDGAAWVAEKMSYAGAHLMGRKAFCQFASFWSTALGISLFTTGLKLRADQLSKRWWPAYRLTTISMIATVGLIACAAVWGFGFSWGSAVLLGAVLAPTHPVLASETQEHPWKKLVARTDVCL